MSAALPSLAFHTSVVLSPMGLLGALAARRDDGRWPRASISGITTMDWTGVVGPCPLEHLQTRRTRTPEGRPDGR